jgi:hypothetical protein
LELDVPLHYRSYENFIFFQYLGATVGNEGIADLMAMLPDTPSSGIAEQQDLTADYPDIERIFHEFVQALSDSAVQDTGGELIPYTAPAYDIDLFGPVSKILEVPFLYPFGTYRFLMSADDDEQTMLEFRESGTLTTSARRAADGVPAGVPGAVSEPFPVPGLFGWSSSLPTELPEEECAAGARMVIATSTKTPTSSGGQLSGASFELDVPDVDRIECCLHGQWVMNNADLAMADSERLGVPVSYGGQITAEYRHDGTVSFVWGGVSRTIEDTTGTSTANLSGGGTQHYDVVSESFLVYSGPEILLDVSETSGSGQSAQYTATIETGLGDFPSQPYECDEDTLLTIIRGSDEIGWQRMQ